MSDQDPGLNRTISMDNLTPSQQQHLRWVEANGGYLAAGRQSLKGCVFNANAAVIKSLARRGLVTLVTSPEGGLACKLGPAKPTIEVTEYTRLDGVSIFRTNRGLWTVRCIKGPAWFWSFATCEWACAHSIGPTEQAAYERPLAIAMAALETVSRVK